MFVTMYLARLLLGIEIVLILYALRSQYHLRITNPVPGQKRKQLWNVIIPQVCTEVINEMIILAIDVLCPYWCCWHEWLFRKTSLIKTMILDGVASVNLVGIGWICILFRYSFLLSVSCYWARRKFIFVHNHFNPGWVFSWGWEGLNKSKGKEKFNFISNCDFSAASHKSITNK